LHDVANIQIVDPLVLVQKAKDTSHIRLILLNVLLIVIDILLRGLL